jgi:signal transduction histidine kinase
MTGRGREADGELGRTLCDIAQVLESAQGEEGRLLRALELLGKLVPYQQCALLEAEPGFDSRLVAFPAMPPEEKNGLTDALIKLFGKLLEERALAPEPSPLLRGAHLAVPLMGLDEVIGVLFVRRGEGTYEKRNLRVLSLVASQLAAYLMMLRARAEEIGRAQELEDARRAAESALRAKDELLDLIAHELKTPLAAAMAWVRVLGSLDLTREERSRAVEAVERSVRTRARLVGDVLDLASITAGALRLDLRPIDPARSIEAAIEGLRPLAEHRSIRLEAALDPSVRPVFADAERLDEVLAILLANAFEFTPDGGRVQVRLEPADAGARIQVIDNGKGFGPDRLPRMFEGLGPQDSPITRSHGGFGLGLAIAKHVVELHGGSIRAESRGEDKGTTFTVELTTAGAPAARPKVVRSIAEWRRQR